MALSIAKGHISDIYNFVNLFVKKYKQARENIKTVKDLEEQVRYTEPLLVEVAGFQVSLLHA